MGGWMSGLMWGGDPDERHPLSGLSRRDVHLVRTSWAVVYKNYVENGNELLKRLFKSYPHTKEFFRMIRNVPEDQFLENPQFKAHVINLMTSLDLAVGNLHQPEVVVAMMHKIGESHRRRQIKESHFDDLKDVIVKMFTEVLKLDATTLGSWAKTLDFWYKNIFVTLNKSP